MATTDSTLRTEQVLKNGIYGVCHCGYVCVNYEDWFLHVESHMLSYLNKVEQLFERMR